MVDETRKGEKSLRAGNLSRRQLLSAAAGTTLAAVATPWSANASDSDRRGDAGVLDVVVVGAGLAGLTAARDLMLAGCNSFVICEARDRVGGRTYNHKLADGNFSEAGGQWIGPGQTAIYDLLRELNIGTFPTHYEGNDVYLAGEGARYEEPNSGGFAVSPELLAVVHELDSMAREVPSGAAWTAPRAAEWDAISLHKWASSKPMSSVDRFAFERVALLANATHPRKLSLLYFLSMLNFAGGFMKLQDVVGGGQELRIEGGSQALSQNIAATLGDRLRLSSAVRKISNWNRDTVSVHTDSGVLRARQVIVALSPSLCQQVEFEPALPASRRELQKRWPAHSPARKTAHVYSKPFWRDRGYNGWVFQVDGVLMWSYDNSPVDASIGVINAFLTAYAPREPSVIAPMLEQIYAEAFGDDAALSPIEFHDQAWGEETWTRGCVSPMPPGLLTSGLMDSLRDRVGSVVWSGTETAEIWHGYMDGAVRSGHRAALQTLHAMRRV